jgi:hypothetical protein
MCTVCWLHQPGGYHLLCNRDEKRTRGIAAGPRLEEWGGVRYVAPMDPDRGGTWIAVNEYGIGLCLLNGDNRGRTTAARSRGLIIPELTWARCIDDCALLLSRMDLVDFAPFTLLLLEPGPPAMIAAWDGARYGMNPAGDGHMPLTSSSFDPDGVRRARLDEFARHTGGQSLQPADLYRFHSCHGASPDAYSPCMHRDDAETVSFSWAVVSADEVRFLYLPTAPCRHSPGEQKCLARAA